MKKPEKTGKKNELIKPPTAVSGFVISRVQSIALGLNANFTKTAVFCKVRHKSEPNLIILPLLKRAVFLYPKSKKAR